MSVLERVSLALLLVAVSTCTEAPSAPRTQPENTAGQWRTWILPRGPEVRPAAPPAASSADQRREIDEIVRLQGTRTTTTDSIVRAWDVLPTAPWHTLTLDMLEFYWALLPDVRPATPVRSARILALV